MRATSPLTASRGSKESESTLLPPLLVKVEPPSSKSRLPRLPLTATSSGRMWCRAVPGPVDVVRSPCEIAHTCSRFQSPLSPPLRDLLREMPEYSRITLLLLFGSWSVFFRASHSAEYDSLVT